MVHPSRSGDRYWRWRDGAGASNGRGRIGNGIRVGKRRSDVHHPHLFAESGESRTKAKEALSSLIGVEGGLNVLFREQELRHGRLRRSYKDEGYRVQLRSRLPDLGDLLRTMVGILMTRSSKDRRESSLLSESPSLSPPDMDHALCLR